MSFCAAETVSGSSGGRPGDRPRLRAARCHRGCARRSAVAQSARWNRSYGTRVRRRPRRCRGAHSRLTKWMPRALRPSTVSSSSLSVRPGRSSRVTHSRSPGRAWSMSSARPGRSERFPEATSVKIRMVPASSRQFRWAARLWSGGETHAYLYLVAVMDWLPNAVLRRLAIINFPGCEVCVLPLWSPRNEREMPAC